MGNNVKRLDEKLVRGRLKMRHRVALNAITIHSWAPNVLMYKVLEKLYMVGCDIDGNLIGSSNECHGIKRLQ